MSSANALKKIPFLHSLASTRVWRKIWRICICLAHSFPLLTSLFFLFYFFSSSQPFALLPFVSYFLFVLSYSFSFYLTHSSIYIIFLSFFSLSLPFLYLLQSLSSFISLHASFHFFLYLSAYWQTSTDDTVRNGTETRQHSNVC